MKNTLKINYEKREIIMDRTFAKLAENTRSEEYAQLQQIRRDYPTFTVVKKTIKKNSAKKTYHGLTYAYMERYIRKHEVGKRLEELLAELDEMLFIAECHSKKYRYPVIKKWFLELYPDVKNFGIDQEEEKTAVTLSESETNIFAEQSEALPKAS